MRCAPPGQTPAAPQAGQGRGVERPVGLDRGEPRGKQLHLGGSAGAVGLRAAPEHRLHGVAQGGGVVGDEDVGQAGAHPLSAAGVAPDRGAVRGVQLRDSGLLLDHLGTVQGEPALRGHDEVAAQACGDAQPAVATDLAGDDADHRDVPAQSGDRGVDLGDGQQAEVRLLQPDTTGLQ
jgi:hypothetical protein